MASTRLLPTCVILQKLPSLSEPQFPLHELEILVMPSHRDIIRFNTDSVYESSLSFIKFKQMLAITITEFFYFPHNIFFIPSRDADTHIHIAKVHVILLSSLVVGRAKRNN